MLVCMEEQEFKLILADVNSTPCYFAKAILSQCCGCVHSQKIALAERENVGCRDLLAHKRCGAWLDKLYQNARFTLHLTHSDVPMPHAKAMKVQCGAPQGLQAALAGAEVIEHSPVADIDALLVRALRLYGSLDALPYPLIVRSINAYVLKKRSRRRHNQK